VRAQYDWAPLHYAAAEGHASVITLLLERGANMEAKTKVRRAAPTP
jgi:ankyrin repeat protein